MLVDYIALHLAPRADVAGLRELCGFDEESVEATDARTAVRLVDRLLVQGGGSQLEPGQAASLTASDRDRLLASVYKRTYGPRIESTVECPACGRPFDLDFSLDDLLERLQAAQRTSRSTLVEEGVFGLSSGLRFRLPTGDDEEAVRHLSPSEAEEALMQRCIVEGQTQASPEKVQAAMEEVGPILDLDLDARCPECSELQVFHFDVQNYLLSMLRQERERLAIEVHQLAKSYGWSLSQILSLPRSRRRAQVEVIEGESPSRRWWIK